MKKEKSLLVVFIKSLLDTLVASFKMVPLFLFWLLLFLSLQLKWEGLELNSTVYMALIQSIFMIVELVVITVIGFTFLFIALKNFELQEEVNTLGVATKSIELERE